MQNRKCEICGGLETDDRSTDAEICKCDWFDEDWWEDEQ